MRHASVSPSTSKKHKLDANGRRLTRSREYRLKLGHVPSIVRLTVLTSNTPISAAKQHTGSTDTELGKKLTNGGGVVAWDSLFVLSIRGRGDYLGNRLLEGDVFEPIEVRFVCIYLLDSVRVEGLGMAADVLEVKLSGTKGGDPRYWKGKVSGRKISDHVHVPMLGIDQDRPTVDSGDALIIPPAVDFIGREIISDSSWKIN